MGRRLVAVVVSLLLAGLFCTWGAAAAWATKVDDALAELDDAQAAVDEAQDAANEAQGAVEDAQTVYDNAQAQLDEIAASYDALSAEIDDMQARIDDLAAQVMEAQQEVLAGRELLGQTAQYEYRSGTFSTMLSVILGSGSLEDLLRNVVYFSYIMKYHADEIATQKERQAHFEELADQLSTEKDAQEEALAELEEQRAAAQKIVDDATAKLSSAQTTQSSTLAALQEQAARFLAAQEASEIAIAENANMIDRQDVVSDDTPVAANPDDVQSADGDGDGDGDDSSKSAADGWLTGVASAYGGSTDPYTPNPGITATGAVCDDTSMGVAVPMSMPNYRSYFGRTVEISYGGKTVYAVVNDCGYMGGGSRVLDLQPGVWKAFGFSSCYDWGLRTVSYRFL